MAENGEPPAIGIDLGTTSLSVAIWQNGCCNLIRNEKDESRTPFYVVFTDDGILVGEAAEREIDKNPVDTVFDPESAAASV
ncbi:Heat shock 70 kDa protein 8 [Acorus calamus]|uniref:Heat shock 70 kDa protein 8 n=1 Tax=Acorus calamus TaxID=4465 RepID=A0AAV9F624_ACOCL|nr:Heat shock 70 kDa protein 8 [Acorus calamus]